MTLIKEDKNTSTIFLKCVVCSAPESKNDENDEMKKDMDDQDNVKVYSPKENYQVGDIIFHKVFNDTGEVIKITKRFNGQNINTVLFKSAGMKKLVTLEKKKA